MKIVISSKKRLQEIKEEFNQFFPFLTLEFFENNQFKKILVLDHIEVGRFRNTTDTDTLTLFPEMSVADLETILWERFQLPVHVLRKSGSVWLKPVHSNKWSLQQQNKAGEIVSNYLDKQSKNNTNQ